MIFRDQLEKVYALIEKPEAWCRESFGCGGRYCLIGAWRHINDSYNKGMADETWASDRDFAKSLGIVEQPDYAAFSTYRFNDTHTHAEVLALLKSAIDRAPVREGAV